MNFLKVLTIGSRRRRIATGPQLAVAIGEGAAFLAQGASYAYIRARSGMMGPRLMQDPGFGRGMERCKWEGFAAAAADLVLIVETDLRPHGGAPEAFWWRLYRDVLKAQGMPPHRDAEGWADRIAAFDLRLAAHLASAPRGIEDICAQSAGVIMDFAPVEDAIRELDRDMVMNNVKFRFIEHVDQLRRRTDWPALAVAIAAAEGAHG